MKNINVFTIVALFFVIYGCTGTREFGDTFFKEVDRNLRLSQPTNRNTAHQPTVSANVNLQSGYASYVAPFVRSGQESNLKTFLDQYKSVSPNRVISDVEQKRVIIALNICGLNPASLNEKSLAFCYEAVGMQSPIQRYKSAIPTNKKKSNQLVGMQELGVFQLPFVRTTSFLIASSDDDIAWHLLAQASSSVIAPTSESLMRAQWLMTSPALVPEATSIMEAPLMLVALPLATTYAGITGTAQWLDTPQGQAWSMQTAENLLNAQAWMNNYASSISNVFDNIYTPSYSENIHSINSVDCSQNPCNTVAPSSSSGSSSSGAVGGWASSPQEWVLWPGLKQEQACVQYGQCNSDNSAVPSEDSITSGDTSSISNATKNNKKPNCRKATNWELKQAGIDPHAYKDEHRARPVSRFDICKCDDGSLRIADVGMCGKTTNFWD